MVEGKYILYAEDDVDDQELLIEMMSEVGPDLRVLCVNDGYDVLHFLKTFSRARGSLVLFFSTLICPVSTDFKR
jgi:CheY-like chemotaxis protein